MGQERGNAMKPGRDLPHRSARPALGPRGIYTSENMLISARADLLGRLGKSIIFSLLALLHLSHIQCYKMRSQTAVLFYITGPQSPEALESKLGGLSGCSLAMEHNTQHAVCSAFPLQTSFKLQSDLATLQQFNLTFPMPWDDFVV